MYIYIRICSIKLHVCSEDHQNADVEFIQERKCDIKPHIPTSRENSNLHIRITNYNCINGVLLVASLLLELHFGKVTKANLLFSSISVYCC